MQCPFCNHEDTKVIDSRLAAEGAQIRRRRVCTECQTRFNTNEVADLKMPRVVKNNGNYETFSIEKLAGSIQRAIEKRPISQAVLDTEVQNLIQKIKSTNDQEVHSKAVGEYVMGLLKELDQIAYVRFASVYKDFKDVEEFSETIDNLRHESKGQPVV
jgi:transcriptional repressor NrdR